jgi:hypothetical protein
MNKIWLTLGILAFSNALSAQKYSNEFLNIAVGARAQGMGGAVVANVNDVTGGYWNPASLANLERKDGLQVGLMHTDWFAGISNYDYLGFALPAANGKRTIGVSVVRFGIDGIPNTLSLYDSESNLNYDNVTSFNANDYAFIGTYAQKLAFGGGNLSVGGNVKVVRRIIGKFANSWGFGADLGAQYRKGNFAAGIVLRDITNTFNSWSFSFTNAEKEVLGITGNAIPISSTELTRPTISFGTSYKKTFKKFSVLGEADAIVTTDGKRNVLLRGNTLSLNPAVGLELGYDNLVFLRAGVSNFQKDNTFDKNSFWIAQPSIGAGLKIRGVHLDYAYTNVGSSEARFYSNTVSLILQLKPKMKS